MCKNNPRLITFLLQFALAVWVISGLLGTSLRWQVLNSRSLNTFAKQTEIFDMELDECGKPDGYKKERKIKNTEYQEKVDPDIQKNKHPSCIENFKHYLWEFCSSTSIHGFHFLGERGRTIPEKIWWLVTVSVALYMCISLIAKTYNKWMSSPVIVTFATSQTPIWLIPFPAVTICPEIKSRKRRFNYTDLYLKKGNNRNVTEQEAMEYDYMSLVCGYGVKFINESVTVTDERAIDFLVEIAPDFNETLSMKYWRGQYYSELRDLFSPVLTSDGLCYTFNSMDRSELFNDIVSTHGDFFSTNGKHSNWPLDSKYTNDTEGDLYPRRTFTSGFRGGLTLSFGVDHEDLDYICGHAMHGFKVFLHNPTEVPRGGDKDFRVPLDHTVFAAVKPNMMTTSDDLKNYKPEYRQCYFAKEKVLKYFSIYNQANCMDECLIDFTLESCGCVWFSMQRKNSTPICSVSKWKCVEEARATYLANEEKAKKHPAKKVAKNCNCLPSCISLEYDVELSQVKWDWKPRYEVKSQAGTYNAEENNETKQMHWSELTVFFKDMQFITSERNELYGQTEFWANCGGLLGLFIGFSFISALEILYYLTMRLICNLYKFGKNYWSGAEELLKFKANTEGNKYI